MQAILRIRSYAGRSPQVAAQVSEMPEILECYKVTGVDCYIMKVAVQSVEHLESIIDTLAHCGDVTTSLVLSTPVERRIIG